jgi:peptidoglycan hydrolase CwlO-like protein
MPFDAIAFTFPDVPPIDWNQGLDPVTEHVIEQLEELEEYVKPLRGHVDTIMAHLLNAKEKIEQMNLNLTRVHDRVDLLHQDMVPECTVTKLEAGQKDVEERLGDLERGINGRMHEILSTTDEHREKITDIDKIIESMQARIASLELASGKEEGAKRQDAKRQRS